MSRLGIALSRCAAAMKSGRFRAATLWVALVVAAEPAHSAALPQARFEDGLVFIEVPAPDHSTLHMLAASEASALLLSSEAAARLHLPLRSTDDADIFAELGPAARIAESSAFMRQHWPAMGPDATFLVVPGVVAVKGWPATADGVLGRAWFAGHTWTWDYPHGQLILRDSRWRPAATARAVPITFEKGLVAGPTFMHVVIAIDGTDIAVDLDMGASAVLSLSALQQLHDGKPALRAASTLAHRVFEALRLRHPDWRLTEDATLTQHQRMLLVPTVEFAGEGAGPVWFIEQPDQDRTVQGSIGGNMLSHFVISIDYPRSRAWAKRKL